eukprot:9477633-Pyramimonas_sp.AAC.1
MSHPKATADCRSCIESRALGKRHGYIPLSLLRLGAGAGAATRDTGIFLYRSYDWAPVPVQRRGERARRLRRVPHARPGTGAATRDTGIFLYRSHDWAPGLVQQLGKGH